MNKGMEMEKEELRQSLMSVMMVAGIGGVRGSVEELTYYMRGGKLVVRRRRSGTQKEGSERQKAQRERLKKAVPVAKEIYAKEGGEWNKAMKKAMEEGKY